MPGLIQLLKGPGVLAFWLGACALTPDSLFSSGGRTITVKGHGFNLVQDVEMKVRGITDERSVSLCRPSAVVL